MSIFSAIKNAIFGHHAAAPAASAPAAPAAAAPAAAPSQAAAPTPAPQEPVDVEAVLEQIQSQKGVELNWRTSIVDLMKLLDIDSSLSNREELATELGYTGAKDGSAGMNIWLHKAVMQELEKNGGKVQADLKG